MQMQQQRTLSHTHIQTHISEMQKMQTICERVREWKHSKKKILRVKNNITTATPMSYILPCTTLKLKWSLRISFSFLFCVCFFYYYFKKNACGTVQGAFWFSFNDFCAVNFDNKYIKLFYENEMKWIQRRWLDNFLGLMERLTFGLFRFLFRDNSYI